MATVQRHTCGAEIVQAASFVTPPVFYDRRGFQEITRCPLCNKKLHTGQLTTVRTFVQGDPLNYAPEGGGDHQGDQAAEIARRISASVERAEAEGRESYAVCMRCGALFSGEYCPNCDQGE